MKVTVFAVGVAHVVRGPLTVIVWVSCSRVDSNVLTPVHLEWTASSLLSSSSLSIVAHQETFIFITMTHLLLCLQALWMYSSHVVGFCADIIVSLVLDKVHTGVICGLCSHIDVRNILNITFQQKSSLSEISVEINFYINLFLRLIFITQTSTHTHRY